MKQVASFLFKLYTVIPYIFFAGFLMLLILSGVETGSVVINDHTFDTIVLKPLIISCVAGIVIFPFVALAILLYNKRRWTKLVYPVLSYSLYILSVVFAGHMGWWTD